jgi:lipopolysaccharide cholinephosphotransferase
MSKKNKVVIYISIFIVLFMALFVIMLLRNKKLRSLSYWKKENYELHINLINLLDKTINILNSNNIQIFLIAGALLGSARGNDLIPWDDDIDIGIIHKKGHEKELVDKIISIYSNVKDVYVTQNISFGLKIHDKSSKAFIDVFLYTDFSNGLVKYTYEKAQKKWPKEFLYQYEVDNLSTCIIKGKEYTCPSNKENILKRWYGEDCLVTNRITHLHISNVYDKLIIKLFSKLGYNKIY